MQVEVSAGRGKPSVIIDKDESLEKVKPSKSLNNIGFHAIP